MPKTDELDRIFDRIKKIMEAYSPPFSVKTPSEALQKKRSYELTSAKKVIIAGRPKDEVYFAGIIKQKDYVGFYYMLAYADPEVKQKLSPDFLKLLKGKSCFYIRSTKRSILDQVRKALDLGLKGYQKRGWV
jgi:hypothetical protein